MKFGKLFAAIAAVAGLSLSASAQSIGPDVTHQDIQDITNYGAVGSIRAFSLGSYTCNLGNVSLAWESNGTPGLAMNAYRLYNGRLMQVGMSFVKTACCAASGTGCGLTCNTSAPGQGLKPGCRDIYGASYNGGQTRLAPRSAVNAFTGVFSSFSGTTGDTIFKRLQVADADLSNLNFPRAVYFVEGVYAARDDAAARNSMNNATYKRVNVDSARNMTAVAGTNQMGSPAILAWRAHGLGVNVPDPRVELGTVDVPSEGRFHYAHKVTDLGNGQWLYDYAVFNLNSHRSAGSFQVTVPDGVSVTNIGFNDVNYHSGEVYDNTNWTSQRIAGAVRWQSPQTFAQNPNGNALRWGTMYNFWFTANRAPRSGVGEIGLFRTGTPNSILASLRVPSCVGDFDNDGSVDGDDVITFFAEWDRGSGAADVNGDNATDGDDVIAFFTAWDANC